MSTHRSTVVVPCRSLPLCAMLLSVFLSALPLAAHDGRLPFSVGEPLEPSGALPANAEDYVREHDGRVLVYWDDLLDTPRYLAPRGRVEIASPLAGVSSVERHLVDSVIDYIDLHPRFFGFSSLDVGESRVKKLAGDAWLVLLSQQVREIPVRGAIVRAVVRSDGTLRGMKCFVLRDKPEPVDLSPLTDVTSTLSDRFGVQILSRRVEFVFPSAESTDAVAVQRFLTVDESGAPGEFLANLEGGVLEERAIAFDFDNEWNCDPRDREFEVEGAVHGFYPNPDEHHPNFWYQTPADRGLHPVEGVTVSAGDSSTSTCEDGRFFLFTTADSPRVFLELQNFSCELPESVELRGETYEFCPPFDNSESFSSTIRISESARNCRVGDGALTIDRRVDRFQAPGGPDSDFSFHTGDSDLGSVRLMSYRYARRFFEHLESKLEDANMQDETVRMLSVSGTEQLGEPLRYFPGVARLTSWVCAPASLSSRGRERGILQRLTPTMLAHEFAHHVIFELTGFTHSRVINCFNFGPAGVSCLTLLATDNLTVPGLSVVEALADAFAAYYSGLPHFGYTQLGLVEGPLAFDISIDDPRQADLIRRRTANAFWRLREGLIEFAGPDGAARADTILLRLFQANRCLDPMSNIFDGGPCLLEEVLVIAEERFGIDHRAVVLDAFSDSPLFRAKFIRGDANSDGQPNMSDALTIFNFLFVERRSLCLDAADVDDSGQLELSDGIRLLMYLFQGGPAPAPPSECGYDPTARDALFCTVAASCDERQPFNEDL